MCLKRGCWIVLMEVTVITVTGHQATWRAVSDRPWGAMKKPRNLKQLEYHKWPWLLWICLQKALESWRLLPWFHHNPLVEEERKHLSPLAQLIKATLSGLWSLLCLHLLPAGLVLSPSPVIVLVEGTLWEKEATGLSLITATPPTVRT